MGEREKETITKTSRPWPLLFLTEDDVKRMVRFDDGPVQAVIFHAFPSTQPKWR